MKVGDIVICKKEVTLVNGSKFYKGNIYYIYLKEILAVYISKSKPSVVEDGWGWFYFNNYGNNDEFLISDYFYTKKDIRKKKLEEINEKS